MSILSTQNKGGPPYRLEYEYFEDYLYVFVGDGVDSLEVSKEYWLKILAECEKKGVEKLLIDEDLTGSLSSNESYQLSVMLADTSFKDILIAFVDRHLEHKASNQFGELIFTNRGGRCKLFKDVDDAKEWLLLN